MLPHKNMANRGAAAIFSIHGHYLFLPGVRHVSLLYTNTHYYKYTDKHVGKYKYKTKEI